MTTANQNNELIRVRIFPLDFDGSKSDRDYVCYVKSLKEASEKGWKYELA